MKHSRLLGILALCAFALTGCGKTSSLQSPTTGGATGGNDEAGVSSALQSNPEYVNEPWSQDDGTTAVEGGAGGFAAIQPLRFWRRITLVESDIHVEYSQPDPNGRPTLAIATVKRHLQGSFNIVAGTPEDTSVVHKPLDDEWTRKLALVRRPARVGSELGPWRIAGTSGVDVRTIDGSTRVSSLRVQAADLDTTITDPLELHRLRRILRFAPGTEVTLTATTADPTDVVLFHGRDARRRFVNNGDGTHTFVFPVGDFPGLRHFGVDALSLGTLFDDALPYDSNAWILAYAVVGVRMPADQ
jgi:hypothetical protein